MTQSNGGVAVIFALEREAAPFRRQVAGLDAIGIHVSGVGRRRTRAKLEQILANPDPPGLIVAAGFCGALQKNLQVGDIILVGEIIDQAGHSWPIAAPEHRSDLPRHRLLTIDRLAATAADKLALGELHGAAAVDMESAAVAEVCTLRGDPFLVVRAVSDRAETALSPELVKLLSGGNVSAWRAIRALVRKPSLLSEFRRLARDTRTAARNLAAALSTIIPQLKFKQSC